jgi:hypothetical protein
VPPAWMNLAAVQTDEPEIYRFIAETRVLVARLSAVEPQLSGTRVSKPAGWHRHP